VPKVSVTVITKNEAADIGAALASVRWADEIVVVDAESTDETVALARQLTERVVVRPWAGYVAQKNFAASLASHDWILSLDADERITPALAQEIQATLLNNPGHKAYRIPRVTWHLGRWIRTTDWYPDDQLRLYDRRSARWTGQYVHEAVTVDGTIGRLNGEIEHYAYRDISDHLETIDRYTTYAAMPMKESGRIRDGIPGFIISSLNAYYVFLKFAKLRELHANAEARTRYHTPEPGTQNQNPEPRT
jgi:glycosyltransferase involved in cell wall biosynthesis